jgi:hypothetical protein
MTLFSRRPALIGIAVVAAMTLAACNEVAPSDQPEAEGALCDSLTAFGASLTDFQDLDPATVSAEDVEAARDAIQEDLDAVKSAAADVSEADAAAVEAAWLGVSSSIDDFSTDVPISEAIVPVQEAAGDVQAAFDEMRDGVGCS